VRAAIGRDDAVGVEIFEQDQDVIGRLQNLEAERRIHLARNAGKKTVRLGIVVHVLRNQILLALRRFGQVWDLAILGIDVCGWMS
jgi:hypothetical protein